MMTSIPTQRWQEMMEVASEELAKWRKEHKQARYTEIEQEVDGHLARVRRQILQDMLLASESAEIRNQAKGMRSKCLGCGVELRSEGKRSRRLTTEHEQTVELNRSYGSCPKCGVSYFPLDEELGLLPGHYTPTLQESMVRIGAKLSYRQAQEELGRLTHTRMGEKPIRDLTMKHGQACERGEKEEVERLERLAPEPEVKPENVLFSGDGAFVHLVSGEWREVKTLVIGEFDTKTNAKGEEEVQTSDISYFARSYHAREFERYSLVETHRRGVENADVVVAPNDGAEWLQSLVSYHVPDAVRVLDFPHSQEYLAAAGKAYFGEGTTAFTSWFGQASHDLKHQGPLATLNCLRTLHQQAQGQVEIQEVIAKSLTYLDKRIDQIDYPFFVSSHYPIGSGSVESGHKVVMQSRMTQAGMRWQADHVDPMLALRCLICNDRWDEGWVATVEYRQTQRQLARQQRVRHKLASAPLPEPRAIVIPQQDPKPMPAQPPAPKQPYRPPADHPWRRPFLNKATFN
jgi:hypothetical protein